MSVFLRLNKHQRQRFANILSPLIYCAEKIICRTGTLQGEIFFSLARKYERSGQFDIAISLMDIALLRLPSQPEVHDYRMKLLQEHYAHRVEWNENTFAEVKSFCGFLGYPRSGHSLVGSIVDAHPNAAIAHEADIFSRFSGPGNETISRLSAFGALYENASVYGRFGREWQGHKYFVDGQYQGRSGSIKVIGDKKGDAVVAQYDRDPGIIKRAQEVFQVPMKFIHVVRNPFDNIARIALRDNRSLDWSVDFYFDKVDIVQRIHQNEDLDILTISNEGIIAAPEKTIIAIYNHLGLEPRPDLVRSAAEILFSKPNPSRAEIDWPADTVEQINLLKNSVPWLKDYRLEN